MRAIAAALLSFIVLGTLIAGTEPTQAYSGVSQCISVSSRLKPFQFSSSSKPASGLTRKQKAAAQKAARLARRKKPASSAASSAPQAPSIDVGLRISKNAQAFYVSAIVPGSAADQAGILPADEIRKVDGKEVYKKYTNENITDILNGPEGTSVVLEIGRQKGGGILSITIVRKKAVEKAEYALQLIDGLLHLKLEAFNRATSKPLREALAAVQWKDVKGMVVDFRTPPTGTLTGMDPIISAFLPKGTPFATIEFKDARRVQLVTNSDPLVPATLPLILLLPRWGSFSEGADVFAYNMESKRHAILIQEERGVGDVSAYLSFDDQPQDIVAYCADRIDVNLYHIGATSIAVTPVPGMDAGLLKARFFIDMGKGH
ncbi:MAG: PDZ domain-containing protein [Candidatus Peribacteraceae bacterium]|jgi:C-terminal processing protease CtpA/Prc